MQCSADPDVCTCVSSTPAPLPPDISEPVKYYRQIGADVIGNRLVIQMEKRKGDKTGKRRRNKWDPPCDCEIVEIQRTKNGPKILSNGSTIDNRILFQVRSKERIGLKNEPKIPKQAILYQVGSQESQEVDNDQCKKFTIYPRLGENGSQEVHTDRITDHDQDVFLLKIKKNPECSEERMRHVEVEVRTPKPPNLPPTPPPIEQPETPPVQTDLPNIKPKKKKK